MRSCALHQNLYWTRRSCGSQRPAPLGRSLLDLEQEVLVIPIPAAAPEHGADVAVDGLDRAELDLLVAVGEDTVEVSQQELGDLAEGRQALPPERAEPRREKAPGGPLIGVVPEMGELLLEQVGFGEAPVERQQLFDEAALVALEVGPAPQEQPPLAPQQAAGGAALAEELGAPGLVDGVVHMAQDVKLVVDDPGVGQVRPETLHERFPHVDTDRPHGAPPTWGQGLGEEQVERSE